MKIIVISSYDAIREGIVSMLSKQDNISIQFVCETIKDSMVRIKMETTDIILLDIHNDNEEELELIRDLRTSETNIKWIILDFYGNSILFIKSLNCGVQGYILGKSTEKEILHGINQIYHGKKYFDPYFVNSVYEKNNVFGEDE